MTRFWKVALAVGGVVALWALSRVGGREDDEEDRPPRRTSSTGTGAEPVREGEPASEPAAEPKPSPETDGGIVRDGRMRGGTWNFAPSDAPPRAGCATSGPPRRGSRP